MPVIREEEIVLLYALYCCGGSATKRRAIDFVLTNDLIQLRAGDDDTVSSRESRVENRIAWTRQKLKERGQLSMPERGTWKLTDAGRDRLFRAAKRFLIDRETGAPVFDDLIWERFSTTFLNCLHDLGWKTHQAE